MKMTFPIIFAGAGPGDPELITVKTQKALMNADVIIYAGSLIPELTLQCAKPEAEIINSASMHLEEIITVMEIAYKKGKKVVRLHSGDPSLYGAIFEQIAELDKISVSYKIIPGVTAAFAAAASIGIEYTLPEITQTLILTRMSGRTPVPEAESLKLLAKHQTSMVIYLSMSLIDEVAEILKEAYGQDAVCAVAFRVSQPEEKIIITNLDNLEKRVKSEKITNQAIIIVGKVLSVRNKKLKNKSKLYDKNFAHEYRKI